MTSPPHRDDAAAAAEAYYDGKSVVDDRRHNNSDYDPISRWMRERREAFRDFQDSIDGHTGLFRPTNEDVANLSLLSSDTPRPFLGLEGSSRSRPHHPHNRRRLSPPPVNIKADDDFRMLSSRDSNSQGQELSPKARVSYDEDKFQVEFDVQDFRPEELSIKTEGDVLVVLAKHETKTENGGSFISKQFEQRFTLPSGVEPENITSSLAKDGTLTVSAPRSASLRKTQLELSNSGNSNSVYGHSSDHEEEGLPHPRVKYDEDKFQISLDCQKYRPEELDVKVEGSSIIITAKQEIKEAGGTRTRVFEQKFTLPSGVKADKVTSSLAKDGVLTITAPRTNPHAQQTIEQRMDRVLAPSTWDTRPTISPRNSFDDLGISGNNKRGSLFDLPPPPHLHHGGGGDGGISKVTYDNDNYKILIDVKDFRPEELIIKTVGNVVQFEARHEEKAAGGNSFSSRNISQSFTLPRGIDPETVTSSMSKDGLLTIAAPLPHALRGHASERLVPIKHR